MQAFFVNKEFRRALTLLNKQELFDGSIRFRYMTALCLAECQEWEEFLSIIGADDTEVTKKCKVCLSMYHRLRHIHVPS